MEAHGFVTIAILFLLLGLHTSDHVADGDGALCKAPTKHSCTEWALPEIHICLKYWFRSFNSPLYQLKRMTAKGLMGTRTQPQLARLGYNISCAARTVFTAITTAPEDMTDESCDAVREWVLRAPLQHLVGAHDKCHACHPNLVELCPEGTEPWCPTCIHEEMQKRGEHDQADRRCCASSTGGD